MCPFQQVPPGRLQPEPLQPSGVSTRRDTNNDVCATVKAKNVEGSNSLRAAIKMQGRNELKSPREVVGKCLKMSKMPRTLDPIGDVRAAYCCDQVPWPHYASKLMERVGSSSFVDSGPRRSPPESVSAIETKNIKKQQQQQQQQHITNSTELTILFHCD